MIDIDTEIQPLSTTASTANPITFAFAIARLQQATIDCAYIFFDQSEPFINGQRRKKYKSRMQIVQEERENMLQWLNSDDFHATCELMGQDSDIMSHALKKVMNLKENAMKVISEYGLRITSKALIVLFLLLCSSPVNSQPFAPMHLLIPHMDEQIPEVVSLQKITQNPLPVRVSGKMRLFYHYVYTYKTKNGNTIDLPVYIKGIRDNFHKHPHIDGLARKSKLVSQLAETAACITWVALGRH